MVGPQRHVRQNSVTHRPWSLINSPADERSLGITVELPGPLSETIVVNICMKPELMWMLDMASVVCSQQAIRLRF